MTPDTRSADQVRAVVDAIEDGKIVLQLPRSDYRLHLRLTAPAESVTTPVGKRIRGVIEGQALKALKTHGGGHFIEPVIGEPRIVTGRVLQIDQPARRVLVEAAAPMWIETERDQDFSVFEEGGLVNFYLASGTRFTPAEQP